MKQGSPEHRLLIRLWALGHCWNEELLISSSIRARSRVEEETGGKHEKEFTSPTITQLLEQHEN